MGWAQPIFLWRNPFCTAMNLAELLEKTLPPMGYELVDWEMSPKGRYVRVFIDKPNGVSVEDCARVSRQLTRLLAVENVDFDRLEVSSPGLDRPLRKAADFLRFRGEEAEFRLTNPVENVRRMKGILQGLADGAQRTRACVGDHGQDGVRIGAVDAPGDFLLETLSERKPANDARISQPLSCLSLMPGELPPIEPNDPCARIGSSFQALSSQR